jgi:transcription factor MYB, plant
LVLDLSFRVVGVVVERCGRSSRCGCAATAERVEREHREKLAELRHDAQAEEKMVEQWAANHERVAKFLNQATAGGACHTPRSWASPPR